MAVSLGTTTYTAPITKGIWVGRVLSGLAIAFLALDGGMKALQLAPVGVAAGRNLVRNIAQLHQRGLVLLLGHKSARSLHARQRLFVGQLAQGAVDCHARHIELLGQRRFARNCLALLPLAALDLLQHMLFDALERRDRRRLGGLSDGG